MGGASGGQSLVRSHRPRLRANKFWLVGSLAFTSLMVILYLATSGRVGLSVMPRRAAIQSDRLTASLPEIATTQANVHTGLETVPTRQIVHELKVDWPLFYSFYYTLYHKMIIEKSIPPRFVVFRADSTGWGNRIRATCTAFLLALLSDRVFLVQHPDFVRFFDPPANLEWDYTKFKHLTRGLAKRVINPHGNNRDRETVQVANLSEAYSQPIWIHKKGNSFHVFLTRNAHYKTRIYELFGTESAFQRSAIILQFLMQNPTSEYRAVADGVLDELQFSKYPVHVAVQVRTNFDDNSAKLIRKHLPHTWWCIKTLMSDLLLVSSRTWVFFATDDAGLRPAARTQLSSFGNVVYYDKPIVHTSKTRGHSIGSGMIEFFALSKCEIMVTTGSSFALAAVRIGQRVLYAGRAGERDGCHAMPNPYFPPDYDDRMENRSFEYILRLPGVRRYANPKIQDPDFGRVLGNGTTSATTTNGFVDTIDPGNTGGSPEEDSGLGEVTDAPLEVNSGTTASDEGG